MYQVPLPGKFQQLTDAEAVALINSIKEKLGSRIVDRPLDLVAVGDIAGRVPRSPIGCVVLTRRVDVAGQLLSVAFVNIGDDH